MNVSKRVVSDNIRALEGRCGVRLLERTTRRVRPTQVGEQLSSTAERPIALTEVEALTHAIRQGGGLSGQEPPAGR